MLVPPALMLELERAANRKNQHHRVESHKYLQDDLLSGDIRALKGVLYLNVRPKFPVSLGKFMQAAEVGRLKHDCRLVLLTHVQ